MFQLAKREGTALKRERERDESWPVGLSAEPEYFSAFPSLTERERALRDREEEKPLKAAEGDRKAAMAFGDREKKGERWAVFSLFLGPKVSGEEEKESCYKNRLKGSVNLDWEAKDCKKTAERFTLNERERREEEGE